jgi:hypothetical protein
MLPPFGLGGGHTAAQTGQMLPNFGNNNNAFNAAAGASSHSINHHFTSQVSHLQFLQQ